MAENALDRFYELHSVCYFREDFPVMWEAYQKANEFLASRYPGRNVRDGTNVTLDNVMRNWMITHNNPFMKRTESIEDALKRKKAAADDYFHHDDPFDPKYRNDLNRKIFVYFWLKDLREKASGAGNQLEYIPPTGNMLPVLYQPMGGYDSVYR